MRVTSHPPLQAVPPRTPAAAPPRSARAERLADADADADADVTAPAANPNRSPALAHTPTAPANVAFPHKLLQKGEVTPESWEHLARAVSTAVRGMARPPSDRRLDDLLASLDVPAQVLADMSPVERNRWASDRFRTMARQCDSLSHRVGRGDRDFADFAALLGGLMTELKRQTLLSSVTGELRHHGTVAAANVVSRYGVDDAMRPLDLVVQANSVGVTAGGGNNWLAKAVACLSAALGTENRFSIEPDSDGQLIEYESLGLGASVRLGLNALLASLDLSVGGVTTFKRGSLTIAPTVADMTAASVKARHDEAPRTLPIVGRSASPAAREWAARYQRCRNGMARIASGFRAWTPPEEPYWLSKTSAGFNTARVRELLETLNERANQRLPMEHGDTLAAMASRLFPLEGEIRTALGPLGSRSVDEIRAIKNGGDDLYAVSGARTDDATGRRKKNHMRSVETALTVSARAGSDYVPLGLAARAGLTGSAGVRRLEVQRVHHDLLNLVGIDASGDPAAGFRALSGVQAQLEGIVRADHRRLGIEAPEQAARHPYLALLHATEPEAPALPSQANGGTGSDGASAGGATVAPLLDLYGREAEMPPRHRELLQALHEGSLAPVDLLRHVEAAYEALYEVACQLHEDTEAMQSTAPERRERAIQGINHRVFAGGYDAPSARDTKEAKAARAAFASHAHNALSLAVWNLSLCQMMAKECFVDRIAHAPLDDERKQEWTALAKRVDERYLQLKETIVDPLQANRLEALHRLSPLIATARCDRSTLTVSADVSIGSDGLLDRAAERAPGLAGTLLGSLPAGPSLGAGGAVGVTLSDAFAHSNILKRGRFITFDGSLNVPPGTGVLTDVFGRTLAGIRDDRGFGSALAFAAGGVVSDAVEDIVNHGDFHALLTHSPGVAFQVQARMPTMVGELQPKPGVQYALLGTTGRKGFGLGLPNLLALTPWTQNGVLEASASTTTSRSNTRVMHIGDEIAFLLMRMSDTGTGRHLVRVKPPVDPEAGSFVASPPESIDFEATYQAFGQDRFEKEALFGSPYQPVLSALVTLAEFDPTRPFAKLRNEDGSESDYISPLASFVKGAQRRVSHIGTWARHFAAGSGTDPFTDPVSLGPLDDLAKKSLQWKREDPRLLEHLRALKTKMADWSADERLHFFCHTDEGRELLSRFWEFVRAHREIMGAAFAAATMEPEPNRAALAAVPTVLGAAAREARSPLKRLLAKIGIGRSDMPAKTAADAERDWHGDAATTPVLAAAAERRVRRMTAPAIEAGVSQPFTPESLDPARSISDKRLDIPEDRRRPKATAASLRLHAWSTAKEVPRVLARTPGAVHRLPGRFLLRPEAKPG